MKTTINFSQEENAKLSWAWDIIFKIMKEHQLIELTSCDKRKKNGLKVVMINNPVNTKV